MGLDRFRAPSRNQIAKMTGSDHEMTRALEALFRQAGIDIPLASASTDDKANALIALSGVDGLQENFGAFTGDLLPDDQTAKSLYQTLETTAEANLLPLRLIFVEKKEDFPAPVGGIITLLNRYAYYMTQSFDLGSDRLVAEGRCSLFGSGRKSVVLRASGLTSGAVFTATDHVTLQNFCINAPAGIDALDLDGTGGSFVADFWKMDTVGSTNMGTIKNYASFVGTDMTPNGSANLIFDGTMGLIRFTNCRFPGVSGQTTINMPATLTVTEGIRLTNCIFNSNGVGGVALNVDVGATIPTDNYVLDGCLFSGDADYVTGIPATDNRARFIENQGISNSASIGLYHMQNNALVTTIAAAATAVKIEGVTTNSIHTQRFTHSDNRLTYAGAITREFAINVTLAATANTSPSARVCIAKNGAPQAETLMRGKLNPTDPVNISTVGLAELSFGDYVEVWIENADNTQDITVGDLVVRIGAV